MAQTPLPSVSQPTIEFGTATIVVGMPKDYVVLQLTGKYELSKEAGDGDDWDVTVRSEPHYLEGFLVFRGGVLVRAGRLWTTEQTAYSLTRVTADILDKFKREGFSSCVVNADHTSSPERSEKHTVEINCGWKSIVIEAMHWMTGNESNEDLLVWEMADMVGVPITAQPKPPAKKR